MSPDAEEKLIGTPDIVAETCTSVFQLFPVHRLRVTPWSETYTDVFQPPETRSVPIQSTHTEKGIGT